MVLPPKKYIMFKIISKNKGFYKLESKGITKNFLEKQFSVLLSEGKILGEEPKADSLPLDKLKKNDLVDIAQRMGYEKEITSAITKAILIEFINSAESEK